MRDKLSTVLLVIIVIALLSAIACYKLGQNKKPVYKMTELTEIVEKDECEEESDVYEITQDEIEKKTSVNTSYSANYQASTQPIIYNYYTYETTVIEEPKIDDDDIIKEVEEEENKIFNCEKLEELRERVKSSYTKVMDFIFNGTEINGKTFKELNEETKLKIIEIATRLEAEIEKICPEYKINCSNCYQKLLDKYTEVTNKICTKIGTEACNQAKDDYQTMKQSFLLTLDLFEKISLDTLDSISNWLKLSRNK